ncbi:MAG: ECF transporter S component [Clostridia bacterium]|nr:ECF transporter S component [Clostridia bacterium]
MNRHSLNKMIITAMCTALCVILPLAFHAIPAGGKLFSPIHIPVLLCGLACGMQYGAICGVLGPLISSFITGMPAMGSLPPMILECVTYGFLAGLLIKVIRTRYSFINLYSSLIAAMIGGRVVAGIAKALYFSPGITIELWVTTYFAVSLPGIFLQLILIPPIVYALMRLKLIPKAGCTSL